MVNTIGWNVNNAGFRSTLATVLYSISRLPKRFDTRINLSRIKFGKECISECSNWKWEVHKYTRIGQEFTDLRCRINVSKVQIKYTIILQRYCFTIIIRVYSVYKTHTHTLIYVCHFAVIFFSFVTYNCLTTLQGIIKTVFFFFWGKRYIEEN